MSCEHVERDKERGAAAAVDGRCCEIKHPRRDAPPIKMTTIWIAGLVILCFGMLIGGSWTVQALDRQYRRLAIERRKLNAEHFTVQETSLRCAWCQSLIDSHVSTSRAVGARR